MNQTPRRATWNGVPIKLQDLWTIRKRNLVARCELFTHVMGWELRIEGVDDLLQTQVCKTDAQIEKFSTEWKAAMIEKGWE